jgi:hypothetical protein
LAGFDGSNINIPSAMTGAKVRLDNTLINAHRGETVLTAPLTRALESGINAQSGGGVTMDVTVNVAGTNASPSDIARAIRLEIKKIERAKGGNRRL